MGVYLGLDAGSISTKATALSPDGKIFASAYKPTAGDPLAASELVLAEVKSKIEGEIFGLGVTGSARELVGQMLDATTIKNEITCQALAAAHLVPDARTIIEIGGQDSKFIALKDGLVQDFAMNTVCAAGTGSFLEHQARRLGLSIEEFAAKALESTSPIKVAGRCTVFAESDLIHAQQTGAPVPDIIYGLCLALARNFLADAGRNRNIEPPVIFQGGVARNAGMVRAFGERLGCEIIVPGVPELSGALGAALLLKRQLEHNKNRS
ncbi:acyl-CoA dehydratase activase [Dehalogenimonas alkenigignens]|uniref:CoA-substrate-specific enzyme activase, putative n=1 Tax=Dehalogenimonas alkenigignens TaxID=1217799 RepID=A0A0W0GJK4_9CHLR|nr:acyl-CoA dehydratase activase [Dehalogenimonas alkenigignens]KTB48740.1 CoA-substrate-specific enzyme activase, putative [Dehalogenimonas alkenigignens]PVV84845.1 ATPase [Dehalogenimonas alkenigignens]